MASAGVALVVVPPPQQPSVEDGTPGAGTSYTSGESSSGGGGGSSSNGVIDLANFNIVALASQLVANASTMTTPESSIPAKKTCTLLVAYEHYLHLFC
jgi:hypothetical protein